MITYTILYDRFSEINWSFNVNHLDCDNEVQSTIYGHSAMLVFVYEYIVDHRSVSPYIYKVYAIAALATYHLITYILILCAFWFFPTVKFSAINLQSRLKI